MRKIGTSKYRNASDWCEALELYYANEDEPYYLLCDPELDGSEKELEFNTSENDKLFIMTVRFDKATRRITDFECICETDKSEGCFARPVTFERSVRPDEQKEFLAYLDAHVTTDPQKVRESRDAQAAAAEARRKAKAEEEAAAEREMARKAQAEAAQRASEKAEWSENFSSDPEKGKAEMLEGLTRSIFDGKRKIAVAYVETALELGISREDIRGAVIKGGNMLSDALIRGDIFIPELLVSLRAMKFAAKTLNEKQQPLVLGFPDGNISALDIHAPAIKCTYDLASLILGVYGFSVIDLEDNDDPATYVNAVAEYKPVAVILVKTMFGGPSASKTWQGVYDAVTACVQDGKPEILVMDDSDEEHSFSSLESIRSLGRMLSKQYIL